MGLPNFIIAGVARCGTTSLYHYLLQHPNIKMCAIKEPKFFGHEQLTFPHNGPGDAWYDERVIKDLERYMELFVEGSAQVAVGEASSNYFYHHEASVPAIKSLLGDVKIIICLRDPIARAWSAYMNMVRDGRESMTFTEACALERHRKDSNYDWMWLYQEGSLYHAGVQHFFSAFSNVLLVDYERLSLDPIGVLANIHEFLGVDESFVPDMKIKYSQSGQIHNSIMRYLTSPKSHVGSCARTILFKMFPRTVLERIAKRFITKPQPSIPIDLRDYFKSDIAAMKLSFPNFSPHWMKKYEVD